jgi:hypothetical protein
VIKFCSEKAFSYLLKIGNSSATIINSVNKCESKSCTDNRNELNNLCKRSLLFKI